MVLFNSTIHTLGNALDYSASKNNAISNNIVNANTPNYKAEEVSFKNVLDHSLQQQNNQRTHPKHYTFSSNAQTAAETNRKQTTYNHNGNNVDMDKEMANLAENQIYYQSTVDSLNDKFGLLHSAIKGGS